MGERYIPKDMVLLCVRNVCTYTYCTAHKHVMKTVSVRSLVCVVTYITGKKFIFRLRAIPYNAHVK